MFGIAVDECGSTCNAEELVADKTEAEVGNAKKRKYFCVACVGGKHPVSLNVRHAVDHVDKKRNYTARAWFSHHGGGGAGNSGQDVHSPETEKHWLAKHILSQHGERWCFISSQCTGCPKHTKMENGVGATGRVEFPETTADGITYIFDTVLLRGEPGSVVVSSVLEVWATHETSDAKREYCLDQGYTFGEFDADHVLEAHQSAPKNSVYELENLKIRRFECEECSHARMQVAIRQEEERLLAMVVAQEAREAREARVLAEQARTQMVIRQEEERLLAEQAAKVLERDMNLKIEEEEKKRRVVALFPGVTLSDERAEYLHSILFVSDEEKKKREVAAQANYDKWAATQVDKVKARQKRDDESHQRWVVARRELQKKKDGVA